MLFIIGISIVIIIVGVILGTILTKKEKFDTSVDCIKFPFLCSTESNRLKNQYSNFGLLHSHINIQKAT